MKKHTCSLKYFEQCTWYIILCLMVVRWRGRGSVYVKLGSAAGRQPIILFHYNDVLITTIASQITSLVVVDSTVYSDADQRKHQSSTSLAFCGEFTGEFPAQRASYAENVSIWWRHHALKENVILTKFPSLTSSCHFDKLQCSRWRKFHQNDISVSVFVFFVGYWTDSHCPFLYYRLSVYRGTI